MTADSLSEGPAGRVAALTTALEKPTAQLFLFFLRTNSTADPTGVVATGNDERDRAQTNRNRARGPDPPTIGAMAADPIHDENIPENSQTTTLPSLKRLLSPKSRRREFRKRRARGLCRALSKTARRPPTI